MNRPAYTISNYLTVMSFSAASMWDVMVSRSRLVIRLYIYYWNFGGEYSAELLKLR